jgi:ABC-type molybdate transport system substrate-binding protein
VYPLALTRTAASKTTDYAAYIATPEAMAVFAKYGFAAIK